MNTTPNTRPAGFTPDFPSWGAYTAEGRLSAVFESEGEAWRYLENRGHMHGGIVRRCHLAASAPELLEALRKQVNHTEQLAAMVNRFSERLGLGKKINDEDWTDNALAIIARATGGQP